jgi:hypothetical protein
VTITYSCGNKKQGEAVEEGKIVAKAGDEDLDEETFLSGIVTTGIVKDSAFVANRFVEKWATEALFYQEAVSKLNTEEIQIDKQVEDYRRTLVNHIYQTKVIEANLDTTITSGQIEAYYNDHRDNFILKDNIIKVNYLKIADKSPVLAKIKKLLYSPLPKDRDMLFNLCSQNAENYYMNDSTWLFVDDIKKEIPSIRDYEEYNFQTGRIIEVTEDGFFYYLKIKDVKTKNSFSPLNFEIQNIRKFILNNRKTQLINQYKQLLLEKAKANQTYTVYR